MRKSAPVDGDRKQHILEAALDVFAEHGFEKATTKEIAAHVGVAQGLVYFYFDCKVDLLFAACKYQTERALSQLEDQDADDKPETGQAGLRKMITRFIQVLDEPRNAKLLRVVAQIELPEEPPAFGSTAGKTSHQQDNHKKQLGVLATRLNTELVCHLQKNLPAYPRQDEILFEAEFIASAIISVLIKRAFNSLEMPTISRITQTQIIEGVLSNIFAWLAAKQAILTSEVQG